MTKAQSLKPNSSAVALAEARKEVKDEEEYHHSSGNILYRHRG